MKPKHALIGLPIGLLLLISHSSIPEAQMEPPEDPIVFGGYVKLDLDIELMSKYPAIEDPTASHPLVLKFNFTRKSHNPPIWPCSIPEDNPFINTNGAMPSHLMKRFTDLALEVVPGDAGYSLRLKEFKQACSPVQLRCFQTSINSGNSPRSRWAHSHIPHEREGTISNSLNKVYHSATRGSGNIKQQNLAIAAALCMRSEYKKQGELREKYEKLWREGNLYPPKREKAGMLGNVNPENYQILTHPERK